MATDDDRYRLCDRLGIAADLVKLHELACKARGIVRPQRAHRCDIFIGPLAAPLEGDAERLEFLLQPADADTELHPAAAEIVERGDFLRQYQWIALRQDHHRGHEAQPGGGGSDPGQPDQWIGQFGRRITRQAAGRPVGIDARVIFGPNDMLDGEHRIETGRFGQPHQAARTFRIGKRVVAEVQGEFHEDGSFSDRSAPSKGHDGTS